MSVFGQALDDVAQLVRAAALHQLIGAEHFIDGGTQRLGTVDYEQVVLLRPQALLAHPHQQIFHCCRVLGRAELNPQHVLAAESVHAHRTDHVMRPELHAIEIDHQDFDFVPESVEQFFETSRTRLGRLAVVARRDAFQQRFEHLRAGLLALAQRLIGWHSDFAPATCAALTVRIVSISECPA